MKRCHFASLAVAVALLLAMLQGSWGEAHAASPKKPVSNKTHERIGNIVSVDSSHILIRTKKGEESKYFVTPATVFGEKNSGKMATDFKPGNLVRIIYGQGEGNQITARQVLLVAHPSDPKRK